MASSRTRSSGVGKAIDMRSGLAVCTVGTPCTPRAFSLTGEGTELASAGSSRSLHRILIQNLKQGISLSCSWRLASASARDLEVDRAFPGCDTARRAKSPDKDQVSAVAVDFSMNVESSGKGSTHWMTAVPSEKATQWYKMPCHTHVIESALPSPTLKDSGRHSPRSSSST